jgi:hypothetical protein
MSAKPIMARAVIVSWVRELMMFST